MIGLDITCYNFGILYLEILKIIGDVLITLASEFGYVYRFLKVIFAYIHYVHFPYNHHFIVLLVCRLFKNKSCHSFHSSFMILGKKKKTID